MKSLRWGLIGASTIGRERVIDAIRQTGGEISSVFSTDSQRGAAYANEFGISWSTTDLGDFLNSPIDAVYISTTNDLHHDQCIAAAKAGKHILCEKPLATHLADAVNMVTACKAANVVLATNHHLRGAATHCAMRDAIKAGKIGKPLAIKVVHAGYLPVHLQGWRLTNPTAGAGAILDLTVHDADLMRFVLDDDAASVSATVQNSGMAIAGVEDAAMGVITFRSGILGQFHDGFTTKYVQTSVEVHGDSGSLIATNCMTQAPIGDVLLRTAEGETKLQLQHENLYVRTINAFKSAIAGNGKPLSTGEDGVASLAIALAALESARTHSVVSIPA
ncbi:MAG: Gfo/Idh/MocA family oxidoreductase [Aestuariivirga sp.]|nr:Gfo/Idh/MocA family oxidoreductase [Aestuariivirga sp.]